MGFARQLGTSGAFIPETPFELSMSRCNAVPMRSFFSPPQKIALAVLFALFSVQVFTIMHDKSATADAIGHHTVNGYVYLKTHDYRMNPAMPPLLRQWMALPWLLIKPVLDLDKPSWHEADPVPFAVDFFYKDNRDLASTLLMSSQIMMFLLSLVMAWAVVLWAKRLYGPSAALFALSLFVFCPTILGYSALANVDNGLALFYFLTVYSLYRWSEGDKRFPWMVALFLGLVLASKYTGILLLPVVLFYFLLKRGWVRGSVVFLAVLFLSLGIVWASYFFEVKPLLQNVPRLEEKVNYIGKISDFLTFGNPDARDFLIRQAKALPIPLSSWILGLAGIVRSHRSEYGHFFMGEWIHEGVWYHYLLSFLLKTTIAFLVLIGWRAATLLRRVECARSDHGFLVLPVLVIIFATFFDSTGVGIRYLVPIYPFLFVWVSGLWPRDDRHRKRWAGALVGVLMFHIVSSLGQLPDHLQYFNGLIGGPRNAYRYFRANDLEWGQEHKNLARYAARHGITDMRYKLFAAYDTSYYGIPGEPTTEEDVAAPGNFIYAISVYYLESFKWTQGVEPDHRIGNVIFIYDFRES